MAGRKSFSTRCNSPSFQGARHFWSCLLLAGLLSGLARAEGQPGERGGTAPPGRMLPVQAQPTPQPQTVPAQPTAPQQAVPAQPAPPAARPQTPAPQPRQQPPAAQPAAPAPTTPVKPGEMLFNFQDADIQAVVKTVSQITGRNFLIDPRVKGKVTIISAKPVSANAVYQIFLSALKAQGFTAVEGPAGIIKIVPEAEGKQSATVSTTDVPRGGDQLTTQVVVIEHGSATQMVPLLRPLMAPGGLLSVYAPANTLIITDYADNIRRLLQIVEKIDQPGSAEVVIIPLEHASALDMAQLLGRLTDGVTVGVGQPAQPGQAVAPDRLSIVPDLRTNSLLVRTDNLGRLAQLRSLIAKLDVPAKAGGNTRVVYLRNAEAAKLAEVLRGLLAGEARAQRPQAQPGQPAQAAPAAAEASLIQADEASNALIISAPDAIYNNLRAVIDKLDARRAQVYVEALIAEVSSSRAAEFGFQWIAGAPRGEGGIGAVTNFPATGSGIVQTIGSFQGDIPNIGAGLSLAYLGHAITLPSGRQVLGLGALARALESDDGANVLSTPNLLTLDNAEAKIVVGQNVPFLTGRFAQTGVTTGTTGQVNPFQTIERRDVGLQLKIKPQISEGNTIKLQLSQEVSSIVTAGVSGAQDLITNKRTLDTTVVIDDGFTIVLGGLIDDNTQENIQEVPILSKIPLLGELFRYRQRVKRKTNLMIFLRPVIVRNAEQANAFTEERYEYIRNIQQAGTMRPSLVLPEFTTPVLPPLTQPPIKEEPKATEREAPRPGAAAKENGQEGGTGNAQPPSVAPATPPAPVPQSQPEPLLGPAT